LIFTIAGQPAAIRYRFLAKDGERLARLAVAETAHIPDLRQIFFDSGPDCSRERAAELLSRGITQGALKADDLREMSRIFLDLLTSDLHERRLRNVMPEPSQQRSRAPPNARPGSSLRSMAEQKLALLQCVSTGRGHLLNDKEEHDKNATTANSELKPSRPLTGRTAIVRGSMSGIGLGIARSFAQAGASANKGSGIKRQRASHIFH
jgi:hypothetical protein